MPGETFLTQGAKLTTKEAAKKGIMVLIPIIDLAVDGKYQAHLKTANSSVDTAVGNSLQTRVGLSENRQETRSDSQVPRLKIH